LTPSHTPRSRSPKFIAAKPTITTVQRGLRTLGYDVGVVDGMAGVRTETAIRLFQQSQKLPADGIAGPATLKALTAALRERGSKTPMVGTLREPKEQPTTAPVEQPPSAPKERPPMEPPRERPLTAPKPPPA
jgi:peptidoglycan hydrolase-like protein with peptidoglycan-binding domain